MRTFLRATATSQRSPRPEAARRQRPRSAPPLHRTQASPAPKAHHRFGAVPLRSHGELAPRLAHPPNTGGGYGPSGGTSTGSSYPVLNKKLIVTNTHGPTFHPCHQQPQFEWSVNFSPTARSGWIVQRVESTDEVRDCDGTLGACDGTVNNTVQLTPLYWEAWKITGGGGVDPSFSSGHDTWRRTYPVPSCGTWSIEGTLYITDQEPPGLKAPNPDVPESVDVPSTITDPTRKVLGRPVGRRRIAGEWSCCDPDPANHYHRKTS